MIARQIIFTIVTVISTLLKYSLSKDNIDHVIEGDILVTSNVENLILQNESENKRDAISAEIFRWKDGIIPYIIDTNANKNLRGLISQAIGEYERVTCIRFKEKSTADTDYISFKESQGCFSAIGRQKGEQTISLGDGCQSYGHVLHEIMHAIGFFHEQSRSDRDKYIRILWWNIAIGAYKNFATYSHGKADTLGAPYDKHSILHYGKQAFSKNGGNTVESLSDPKEVLGQETLSDIDILQINKLYGCFKGECKDESPLCARYKGSTLECFNDVKVSSKLCRKTCGFCTR